METGGVAKKKSTCKLCDKIFSRNSNLNRHIREHHGMEPEAPIHKKSSLACPSCYALFALYSDFRDHLIEVHDLELYKEEKVFKTREAFKEWKKSKEMEMKCVYVKKSGRKVIGKKEKHYYVCHRSARSSKYSSSLHNIWHKLLKSKGSGKLKVTCPSTLELIFEKNKFRAILFIPHFGHECNLFKNNRKQMAEKIAGGISFEKILDDICDELDSQESLERLTLLKQQDLRNNTRDFLLPQHVQLHSNDDISIRLWIERLKAVNNDIPLLFYKAQGVKQCEDIYDDNDFVLILMTKFQRKQLLTYGSDKIYIDSTHETTNSEFLLTTLMVVDEFDEAVPAAFLLSNKVDIHVLTHFFQSIKVHTGEIKCKVFMSNDVPDFYDAWTNCMSVPDNQLLSAWHVDRNWRKKLDKIKGDQQTKAKVYKSLRILLKIKDPDEFKDMQNLILTELVGCEGTIAFGEYFRKLYADRCNLWAYAYRQEVGIDTYNMYLEAIHRTLKHIYVQAKKNNRVDICLHSLLKLLRDITIKKIKKGNIKGIQSYKMNLIKRSHLEGEYIKANDIFNIEENIWNVKPSIKTVPGYFVQRNTAECFRKNKNCHLFCKSCETCVHEFTCTCLDFFIKSYFCNHIHAVIKYFFQPVQPIYATQAQEDSKVESIQDMINPNVNNLENDDDQDLEQKLDLVHNLLSSKTLISEVRVGKILEEANDLAKKNNEIVIILK